MGFDKKAQGFGHEQNDVGGSTQLMMVRCCEVQKISTTVIHTSDIHGVSRQTSCE